MTSETPEAKRPPGFLRKDFICYVCQLKVTGKKALVTHMKEIHKEDKCFKCRFCDFKTEWNHRLKDHELRLHEEIKPSFPCDMCKYETVSLSALIWHKKIHLKEKFSCKDCQFEADAIIELRKHRKTQHVENKKNIQLWTMYLWNTKWVQLSTTYSISRKGKGRKSYS